MSVTVQGESRVLVALGVGWWNRHRLRLWLHFLPRRVWCGLSGGHRFGAADPSITVGPLHVPPSDREYHVLGFTEWCERCSEHRDVHGDVQAAISEARAEDEEEWADPEIRSILEGTDGV